MKPQLSNYIGQRVTEVISKETPGGDMRWQWYIRFEGGAKIVNKSCKETFPPTEIIGARFTSMSLSTGDTTLHFSAPNGHVHKIGLNPTQYAIDDPRYGGEAYPQWPEELEEKGIPSHPQESVSHQQTEEEKVAWQAERERLLKKADERREDDRRTFLADTEETDGSET